MPNFKQSPMDPRQLMMFQSSVDESIPANAEVRILSEVMENLDWSELESSYSDTGCPPYPPKVLAKILVYGLSRGIRSSRVLEDMTSNHKHYIFLAGGLTPDHCTISRFRKDKEAWLRSAFTGTVRICAEAGHVLLKVAATDGSKIQAQASKKSLYDQKRIDREMAAIDRILAEAEETDRLEDEVYGSSSGNAMPTELADAKKRKDKLKEIEARLEKSGAGSVSSTEEECRVMKTTNGLRPAYNTQITVDSADGVILAADVTDAQTDNGRLEGQLKQVEENTGLKVDVSLADTGYSDEATYEFLADSGQEALIPPKEQPQGKKRKDLFASKCFLKDENRDVLTCPAGRELTFRGTVKCSSGRYRVYTAYDCRSCSFYDDCVACKQKTARSVQLSVVADEKQAIKEKLKTPEGKELYALRQETVERVFANIKSNKGLSRFSLRGMMGAKSEFWLACM
ncbi:MAG: IS1182 family transposase, partial [bacterium]|nr:IS1182 family transposase [bacterium]